jgi:hypothetical protein
VDPVSARERPERLKKEVNEFGNESEAIQPNKG